MFSFGSASTFAIRHGTPTAAAADTHIRSRQASLSGQYVVFVFLPPPISHTFRFDAKSQITTSLPRPLLFMPWYYRAPGFSLPFRSSTRRKSRTHGTRFPLAVFGHKYEDRGQRGSST